MKNGFDYAKKMFSTNGEANFNEIIYLRKEVDVLIKDNDEIYNGLLKENYFGLEEKLKTATTTIYYFYDNIEELAFYIIDYQLDGMGYYFNNYPIDVRNSNKTSLIKKCQL